MRLLADSNEPINLGGPSSTHLVLAITRERAIVTANGLEVVEARNEVVDMGCLLGTAAKVGEKRAESVQTTAK